MPSDVDNRISGLRDSSCRPVSPSMLANPPPASRDPCRKVLKGQFLSGPHSVYDIDKQLPSDSSDNLEGLPISVYGWDPALVAGRQIAVNKRYICYCLRPGSVRILSRNVAAWGLFQAHPQKVTDIAFFGESVHVVASASSDGRLFVWKILEDVGADGRIQLIDQVLLGIQFDGEWKDAHPSVCWHPSSQECLLLCISKYILKIDMNELSLTASLVSFSSECFLNCSITNLITGVHLIGQHNDDVTDLCALCQETLYIASSSKDGTVRVWADGTTKPLADFLPHEGQPVSSISFIDAPSKPSNPVLLTGGYLNQSLKLWAPISLKGSLESKWCSVQSLELKSSAEGNTERAFCNQVCVVPQTGIVLLGNSKKHAMYSIHLGFGETANETRMDYLVEFAMSMPILSLTATADIVANRKGIIQVFCIQTQAIQEYFLNVSICLPPQQEEGSDLAAVTGAPEVFKPSTPDKGEGEGESTHSKANDAKLDERGEPALGNRAMVCEHNSGSGFGSWVEVPTWVAATIKKNAKLGLTKATPESYFTSERLPGGSLLSNVGPPLSPRLPSSNLVVEKSKFASGNPVGAQRESIRSQLVTPSELMAMACFPAASNEREEEFPISTMNTRAESTAALITNQPETSACAHKQEEVILSEAGSHNEEGNVVNDHPGTAKRTNNAKKKKNKNKNRDGYGEVQESLPVPSSMAENASKEFRSRDNKTLENIGASEIGLRDLNVHVFDMQESLNQLIVFQKELQRHVLEAVSTELAAETRRAAAPFEQCLNNLLLNSLDPLCVKINDVKKDTDTFEQAAFQELVMVLTDRLDKEAMPAFEFLLKMEAPRLESTISHLQSSYLESILAAVLPPNLESLYQNCLKLMETSLPERISTSISHQLQRNFMLEKQSMQSDLCALVQGKAFSMIQNFVQNLSEHVYVLLHEEVGGDVAYDEQLVLASLALARIIKDTLTALPLVALSLEAEMKDMERKICSRGENPLEDVRKSVDIEVTRLVKAGNFEDAFRLSLSLGNTNILAWTCKQVDPRVLFSSMPPPLSQGVAVSLLYQLVNNMGNDSEMTMMSSLEKLLWIEHTIFSVDPTYLRPLLEQLYVNLQQQMAQPLLSTEPKLTKQAHLLIHVVNSLLTTCK